MSDALAIDARLRELGVVLPLPAAPAGAYVPYVRTGSLVFVSGQLPMIEGTIRWRGRVGAELSIEEGAAAARLCAINLLAQIRDACEGDLGRVARVVRLGGFVQCGPGFYDHPKVLNGASELMRAVFLERGRHARAAVGCVSLPLDAAVEVDGVFEVQ